MDSSEHTAPILNETAQTRHLPPTTFLERARALVASGPLVAVPLAVAATVAAPAATSAAGLTVDYSAVTGYSNSGFFTGFFLDQTAANGAVSGNTAALSGTKTVTDSYLFWRYDDIADQTAPRFDTTGLVFYFGGQLPPGARSPEDLLRIAYDFTVNFEHTSTGEYDYPQIGITVAGGHNSEAYELDLGYPQRPNLSERQDFFEQVSGFETPSSLRFTGSFNVGFPEWLGNEQNYWSALIAVSFEHEFVSSRNWDGENYSKLNGDVLSVTLPADGLTVTYEAAAAIPEPAHAGILLGGLAGFVCMLQRRRHRS